MRLTLVSVAIVFFAAVLFSPSPSFALTTEELLQLKKAGVAEDVILFMVESNYRDVDKVLKLKGGGFKDETILSIVKKDLSEGTSQEVLRQEKPKDIREQDNRDKKTSKIKIIWYGSYGEPLLLAEQEENKADISFEANTLKFEWPDDGTSNFFLTKPFKAPFFWEINADDTLGDGEKGYTYKLMSTTSHKGRPQTDSDHYWTIYIDPGNNTKIADYIEKRITRK